MKKYDVIIVGAGPGGIFSAYELVTNNSEIKVAVFEKGHLLEKRKCPIDGDKVKKCISCKTCSSMSGFGGAGAFSDGTCGAISGAAVVAGLINQDKAGTSQTVRSVMNQFKQQNGTVICKDLKGVETGKVIRSCDDCVRDAVKFLEDALKSEN